MTEPAWRRYLSGLDAEKRGPVERALELARRLCPEAEPAMPYGVPGLRLQGKNLIAVAAFKKHLGIYPFSPEVIEALQPVPDGVTTAKGTLRFPFGTFPAEGLLARLIELRSQEIS